MTVDKEETTPDPSKFDPSTFADNALFHDRRTSRDRRGVKRVDDAAEQAGPAPERRARKERRRRVDPTTFEKQYTPEEMEFMNAMQHFKVQTGKAFPSHEEVLKVAYALGYRKVVGEKADGPAENGGLGKSKRPKP